MMDKPFLCEPWLRPVPWGGRRLGARLGKTLPSDALFGESWEVSDHASHASKIATGPAAGRTLRDLMASNSRGLLGRAAPSTEFPWLIKWLDCHDWLSVQVHPDDALAPVLWPGERGKTEAWFIVEVEPTARIYAGLKPGIDEPRLRAALKNGTVAECLHSFVPLPGDCVFLPAGTVHAVGGGVLMAEVQQTSDATFRLFDWNRRDAQGQTRQLHVEESLAAIHWDHGPVKPIHASGFDQVRPGDPVRRQPLCGCGYFELAYWTSGQPMALGGSGRLQAVIVVRGNGVWQATGEVIQAGQAWIVPAAAPAATCQPRDGLEVIVCTMP